MCIRDRNPLSCAGFIPKISLAPSTFKIFKVHVWYGCQNFTVKSRYLIPKAEILSSDKNCIGRGFRGHYVNQSAWKCLKVQYFIWMFEFFNKTVKLVTRVNSFYKYFFSFLEKNIMFFLSIYNIYMTTIHVHVYAANFGMYCIILTHPLHSPTFLSDFLSFIHLMI